MSAPLETSESCIESQRSTRTVDLWKYKIGVVREKVKFNGKGVHICISVGERLMKQQRTKKQAVEMV